jgi:hypothetical protein
MSCHDVVSSSTSPRRWRRSLRSRRCRRSLRSRTCRRSLRSRRCRRSLRSRRCWRSASLAQVLALGFARAGAGARLRLAQVRGAHCVRAGARHIEFPVFARFRESVRYCAAPVHVQHTEGAVTRTLIALGAVIIGSISVVVAQGNSGIGAMMATRMRRTQLGCGAISRTPWSRSGCRISSMT